MTVQSFEVGFVSKDDALVAFYTDVLGLAEVEPVVFPMGVVRRLSCGAGLLKVMIPTDPPSAPPVVTTFYERSGIRYATMWVDDLDAVVGRWRTHGGAIHMDPFELRPGVRCSIAADPDGNAIELMEES